MRDRGSYASLLDEETWAFVDRVESSYPANAADLPVAEQRAAYDRMCREFHSGCPDGVAACDEEIDAQSHIIPVRVYACTTGDPGPARVVYFHGGGFVLGGLDSHDDLCAGICAETACEVVSVAYRLSPEHLHPAAFDDALDGFDWASRRDGLPLILAGDSSGGNLAAAVAHAKRGRPEAPIGQVLVYPELGGDPTTGSFVLHSEAPMLTLRELAFYRTVRTGGRSCDGDPTLQPLADTCFSGLPPTVVISAECDPLSSDGEMYCRRIREAGGKAAWFNETGLVHGYLRARHSVRRAAESFARLVDALNALARQGWPYEEATKA